MKEKIKGVKRWKALESNLYPLLLNSWKGHGCDLFKNKDSTSIRWG
jgi:hypothetical protein